MFTCLGTKCTVLTEHLDVCFGRVSHYVQRELYS